jgi:hypothetical protein
MTMEQTAQNGDNIALGGTARRATPVFTSPRQPVIDHNAPEGL